MRRFFVFLLALFCLALFAVPSASASEFGDRVAGMAKVSGVRVGATSSRVRIVIDASKKMEQKTMVLREPGRIVVDLQGAWLDPAIARETPIGSRFASKVRVSQFDKDTVRVVIFTEVKKDNYKIFSFAGGPVPYRVVMDFGQIGTTVDEYGAEDAVAAKPKPVVQPTVPPSSKEINKPADKKPAQSGDNKITKPDDKKSEKDKSTTDKTNNDQKLVIKLPKEEEKLRHSTKKLTPGLKNKIIVLDPGHGGCDPGAIGPTGLTEKSITLRIAADAKKRLEAGGAKVIMTCLRDIEVSPKRAKATDIEELQARCDIANKANADIFLSIHMDSFSSGEAKGTTGYYYAKGTFESKQLAKIIQESIVKRLGTQNRGPKSCNFYVVKHTEMTATLIEVAFLSNPKEEKMINSNVGIQKAGQAIAEGISQYFGKAAKTK